MINNNYPFADVNRSMTTNRLFFNVIVFIFPLLLVFWVSGVWVCLISILIIYNLQFNKNSYLKEVQKYFKVKYFKYILISYILYFIFSWISIIFFHSPLKSIDNACVFIIWLLISPVIALLRPSSRILGYGGLVAVIGAFLLAAYQFHVLKIDRPYGMYGAVFPGTGAIKFGDITFLIGILTYILLSTYRHQALGALGVGLGFTVCLYAGARGGVFAAVLCVLAWFVFIKTEKISKKKLLIVIVGISIVFFMLNAIMDDHILSRISTTIIELFSINRSNYNTSIGERLQMWRAALLLFQDNPVFGVGLNNFNDGLLVLYKQHIVPRSVIKHTHAHNEYLCALATGGIVGLAITVSLFFIPICFFKKYYHNTIWGKLGFWSVCLMAFFALTDCVFDRRMTVIIFVILISFCIAGNMSHMLYKTSKNSYPQ